MVTPRACGQAELRLGRVFLLAPGTLHCRASRGGHRSAFWLLQSPAKGRKHRIRVSRGSMLRMRPNRRLVSVRIPRDGHNVLDREGEGLCRGRPASVSAGRIQFRTAWAAFSSHSNGSRRCAAGIAS
jgi:hypothetical protein